MATSKKLWPLVERNYKLFSPRSFHTTVGPGAARPAARMSPRIRAQAPPSSNAIRVAKQTHIPQDCLPPMALLESKRKSGALTIEPQAAREFLLQYLQAGNSTINEQKLFTAHNITPSTMMVLADVLRRCSSEAQRALAKKLMRGASARGDKTATFEIITSALNLGILDKYADTIQRLALLAKKETDPQAMMLLGKVLFAQSGANKTHALEWFQKATRYGNLDFEGASDALVSEGWILLQRKDNKGAKKAFERAARELDDPSAFFYLSQLYEPNSAQQKTALLKAASSGVVEACHNLGSLELAEIDAKKKKLTSISNYGMAREWFLVAAADGFGLSMLNLALMHKAVGDIETAFGWLDKAESVIETEEQAKSLRDKWLAETRIQ